MDRLNDRIAIVTGAGGKRGLGRAISERLAREGADVAVVDRESGTRQKGDSADQWLGIKSVAREIEALGRRAFPITCDVADAQDVSNMVSEVVAKFGKIDILVNNAGVHSYATVTEMSDDIWNQHLAVNLTGTFLCSKNVARRMVQQGTGGRIINIASALGKTGAGNGQSAYCASKFGVIGFTQCLALELAPSQILVNAICPTLLDTDLHLEAFRQKAEHQKVSVESIRKAMNEDFVNKIPLGRMGTPNDVANLVSFLCSEEASFITGQSVNVNGGFFTAL